MRNVFLLAVVSASALASPSALGKPKPEVRRPKTRVVTFRHLDRGLRRWTPSGLRSGGLVQVNFSVSDADAGLGSLELSLPGEGGFGRIAFVERWSRDVELVPGRGPVPTRGGFGRLADLEEASYAWYRAEGGTAPGFLAIALRLFVHDPDQGPHGATWQLVYEPVYNGVSVAHGAPTGTWVRSDAASGSVWRVPIYLDGSLAEEGYCAAHPLECYRYDRGPKDWGFGENAVVVGLQLAAGSGWQGSFEGHADDVRLRFSGRRERRWDFEPVRR